MRKEDKALLIDGFKIDVVNFTASNVEEKLGRYYELIGCDCIDIVTPYGLEDIAKAAGLSHLVGKFCMVVDDEALLKENPKVNAMASLLYGVDLHGQPLCGSVLVAKNQATDDGIETVGLNQLDIMQVQSVINALVAVHNEKVAAD